MSNHQSDDLFIETLSRSDTDRLMLSLKPVSIKPKQLKKIEKGMLIDGFDPYNLRIISQGDVIARAKLGKIENREALYIVSASIEEPPAKLKGKSILLEARMSFLPDGEYSVGDVVEFDDPISQKILIVADTQPVALAELVEYDQEDWVHITRVLSE